MVLRIRLTGFVVSNGLVTDITAASISTVNAKSNIRTMVPTLMSGVTQTVDFRPASVLLAGYTDTISRADATTSIKSSANIFARTAALFSAIGAISRRRVSPKQIWQRSFTLTVLFDWAPGAVAEFRSYQYGGPKAAVTLAHAFPNMTGNARGAWCGTREGTTTTHWWPTVVGHKPTSVIIVHGPGEGIRHVLLADPPRLP